MSDQDTPDTGTYGAGMGRTPDFFEDLRRVGGFKRAHLGGLPTDNELSKIPREPKSRDTIGAWLRGERFPQQLEPLLAVLREVKAEAARQGLLEAAVGGNSNESVAELLAEDRWRRGWAAEQGRRTRANQDGVERKRGRQALEAEERRARQAALADRPRPVRSWTPQRLGVHPAIPGHPTMSDNAAFVLPTYVPRPHDDSLHARLSAAVTDSASLLVVVRGESCTGKTRTAFEALAAVPDEFQLLFPTDADSLLAMLAADALGPRSVLWMNEAQHYLDGSAGEAAAAALLRRLDAEGPFIVLTTLWPDHDRTFTTAPAPRDDPHRQVRALLAQAHYVRLPGSFADNLGAVRHAAAHDRSLTAALEAGGTTITQVLAAGPDLVAHYEHPAGPHGIYSTALLSAAMDAHRLGVTGPLPLAFLHDAAPGYLTESERAAADPDTWFANALTHARTLVRQIIRPLQDVPRSPGMGALPGVACLADYLQQHGRRTRRLLCPPAAFWNAAAHHLTSSDDLTRLAKAARDRYRIRHAAHLYCAAAGAGNHEALTWLAHMRAGIDEQEEFDELFRTDIGNVRVRTLLKNMRVRADHEEEHRLRQAADAGNVHALMWLAKMRVEAGDEEEAERLYRAAGDAGLTGLAEMQVKAGDEEEAERLYRAAAEAGNATALMWLAKMRVRAGDEEEAERLYRATADSTNVHALMWLAKMRVRAGDEEEAERLYRAAGDAGLTGLAEMQVKAGDEEEAERLYRAAADAGDPRALMWVAESRVEAGDEEEAERLYRAAADAGDLVAPAYLAWLRMKVGDQEGAERLASEAADTGEVHALRRMEALGVIGAGELKRLVRQAADVPGRTSLDLMSMRDMLQTAGDKEGAERLARQLIDAGDLSDKTWLETLKCHRYGLEADGTVAEPWVWPEPRTAARGSSQTT